ncbi:MAG TPA: sensor histidine kinase [Ohtaekwangia sp.]|nr:sensor histidine kinase [Ohtaekwangia sp.]
MIRSEILEVYLIIAIALVAMFLMVGSIILFVLYYQKRMVQEQFKRQQMELEHQKKMMEAALESQENERRRVAADLHDSIGAMLSTVRVSLITQARKANADVDSITESKKMLDDTIDSVRRISRDLMPSTLEKFGLTQAVKEMCERFQSTSSVPIVYMEEGEVEAISKKRELMIFRILQELLNNALKHAAASMIKVTFIGQQENARVVVEDNGIGFDVALHKSSQHVATGLGLYNIENRARLVGAEVEFHSIIQQGSRIALIIPYEKV